jgi:alkylation response protein AidB-like acyl-CoA dehydrogenase
MDAPWRLRLREFIAANLPGEWRDAASGVRDHESLIHIRQEWGRRLHAGGWAAPTLGTEDGGLGLSGTDLFVYIEEMVRAGAPEIANSNALNILAPVLVAFGTQEQRARNLPAMLAHQTLWCQGFSEPDAGSDLAHLRTRAVEVAGGWRVSGQKVWTTNATHAERCYLLARTDPDAEAHSGLSLMLIDIRQPGVEVRPLRNMVGTYEFCEVFLNEAFVPADDLVGQPGDGWKLASYALDRERGQMLGQRALRMSRDLDAAYELIGADGAALAGPGLGRAHAAVRASEAMARRNLSLLGAGHSPGLLSAAAKLVWSETHQRLLDIVADARGPGFFSVDSDRSFAQLMLSARAETIYAGTSEIQRNLIARQIGLPGSRR